MVKAWIEAFRLRTLPLALACIGMGSFLAAEQNNFKLSVFLLSASTTILLQVLSNLANDYGDTINGADSDLREGPLRQVQSGRISLKAMKSALVVFSILSFLSGITLLYVALSQDIRSFLFFLLIGILSIAAAIKYTAGTNPYGYAGLGDLSVLVFFGWVGVLGTFFLHTGTLSLHHLLPATSCGLFSTAVLNVNNIRDMVADRQAGKFSIPVRIGRKNARIYHWALLLLGFGCAILYVALNYQSFYQWIFVVTLPFFIRNGIAVSKFEKATELDPFLKQMAISTLLFVISFGVGQVI